MHKLLMSFTFLAIFCLCRSTEPSQAVVRDQKFIDTKELTSQIVKENSQNSSVKYVIDSITTFVDNKNIFIDSILNKKQLKELHQETREQKSGIWTKAIFDHIQIVPEKYVDSLRKKRVDVCYFQFSRPIFTSDGQYCVLDVEFHHPYNAFFWEYLGLFHKEHGKWKRVWTYSSAIS
jgi:hypothetical protein